MLDSLKYLRAPVKNNGEMDWQLVASYFTVKSTDIFAVHGFARMTDKADSSGRTVDCPFKEV